MSTRLQLLVSARRARAGACCRVSSACALLLLLFAPRPALEAQQHVAAVTGVLGDTVFMALQPGALLVVGERVHIARFDSIAQDWIALAEVQVAAAGGDRAVGRVHSGRGVTSGDRVLRYPAPAVQQVSLRITPAVAELFVATGSPLRAEVVDAQGIVGIAAGVAWQSSDPGVLVVSDAGYAAAVTPGEAIVTARSSTGLVAAQHITVVRAELAAVAEHMQFAGTIDTVSVLAGGGREVRQLLHWHSSNEQIVSADSAGILRAHRAGIATVRGVGLGGAIEMAVEVVSPGVTVRLEPAATTAVLERTDTLQLAAWVLADTAAGTRAAPLQVLGLEGAALRQIDDSRFEAIAPGRARVRVRAGPLRRLLEVQVMVPRIRIARPGASLTLGERYPIDASYVRADGSARAGAAGAEYDVLTPRTVAVHSGVLESIEPGRAVLVAREGERADTLTAFVLGELLLGLDDGQLATFSMAAPGLRPLATELRGRDPDLSPDGTQLLLGTGAESRERIQRARADGSDAMPASVERRGPFGLGHGLYAETSGRWAADGSTFYLSNASGSFDVYVVAQDTATRPLRLRRTGAAELAIARYADPAAVAVIQAAGETRTLLKLITAGGRKEVPIAVLPDGVRNAWRMSDPAQVPGSSIVLVLARDLGFERSGDQLLEIDYTDQAAPRLRVLVEPRPGKSIKYALSPDGERLIYLQYVPAEVNAAQLIEIRRTSLEVLRTAPAAGFGRVQTMSWGADPTRWK